MRRKLHINCDCCLTLCDVSRYALGKKVGEGQYGEVFLASRIGTGETETFAAKVWSMLKGSCCVLHGLGNDESLSERTTIVR